MFKTENLGLGFRYHLLADLFLSSSYTFNSLGVLHQRWGGTKGDTWSYTESFRLEKTFKIILSVTCLKISCWMSPAHAPGRVLCTVCTKQAVSWASYVHGMAVSLQHGPRAGGTMTGGPSLHNGVGSLEHRMLWTPWEEGERCPVAPWLTLPTMKSH